MIVTVIALMLGGLPQAAAVKPAAPTAAKPICRRETATGSIMPGKRTCHTLAEWKQIDEANAKAVDQFRDQSGRSGVN